ncbi:MAG TPA: hypothetical protein PLG75_10210, partial [Methanoculleus sp.]|nr:hypothetical protein [Methanoculleus sp.]
MLTYARSIPGMPASPGIIPDMRYLSPAYLPMLVIGVYAFKHAGLDGDGVREALRTLFWLAVVDLPLIFVVLQVIAGNNPGGQVTFVTTLTYLFLDGAAVLYIAVLARRASPRLLEGRPAAASRHNGYQECGWVCGSAAAYHPVCPTRQPQSQSISSNPTGTVWMNSAVIRMSPTGYRSPTAGPERRP